MNNFFIGYSPSGVSSSALYGIDFSSSRCHTFTWPFTAGNFIVVLIIERIATRVAQAKLQKLNMVLGAFFTIRQSLLRGLLEFR